MATAALFISTHEDSGKYPRLAGMIPEAAPTRPWGLIAGKHWQIASPEGEDVAVTDEAEHTRGECAAGMVEVSGQMRLDSPRGTVEDLQDGTCTEWINRDFPARCAVFDEAIWRNIASTLPTRSVHYCIDRFEYPNRKGQYPVIFVTWHEAESLCAARSERLCTEDEWTFACEGEDALPYPYGYVRNRETCVIDRPWILVNERELERRDSTLALRELDALWQGEASGARPLCRSHFGVYDMTGNVDEWTASIEREGFRSIGKGGYWGPVRARCRPSTRVHNEDFYYYQIGFRCCADARSSADAAAE